VKNIQVIDGADNCTFSLFQLTDEEFAQVFPADAQDIQFAEDLTKAAMHSLSAAWERPVRKPDAVGIHGTLFYGFASRRGSFPASKRDCDWDERALNPAQRRMYASARNRNQTHD
jgi:hypothetical protein